MNKLDRVMEMREPVLYERRKYKVYEFQQGPKCINARRRQTSFMKMKRSEKGMEVRGPTLYEMVVMCISGAHRSEFSALSQNLIQGID